MSKLELLNVFESAVLDELPTGEEATELLDRLKAIENLIAGIKAHYKEALARDCSAVPGWFLQPGAIRRAVIDPMEAYRRVSETLSPEQFAGCVTVKIGELERLWASSSGESLSAARANLERRLVGVIEEKACAPSLVRMEAAKERRNGPSLGRGAKTLGSVVSGIRFHQKGGSQLPNGCIQQARRLSSSW
jgi:hypothetical protein